MFNIPVLEITDYTLPMIFTGVELHLLCNPFDIFNGSKWWAENNHLISLYI